MKDLPLRRGQLVTTFGPGALVVSPEGETAIIGALDKWFYDKNGYQITGLHEYEIQEPRLKSLLRVKHLLLPPDFRPSYEFRGAGKAIEQTNTDTYIPLLRFPAWHYCPKCKTLHKLPLSSRTNWMDCKECQKPQKMIQVPFVIVCEHGHISDFPWREWVHEDEDTLCSGQMKLISTGGATLDSLKVRCSCKKERSLRGIMLRSSENDDNRVSELGRSLNKEKDKYYKCPGRKPWFGSEDKEVCESYPTAVLKNSVNVYFPLTVSALHLPGERSTEVEELIDLFERYGVAASLLETLDSLNGKINLIRQLCPPEINEYTPQDIELALLYLQGADEAAAQFENRENRSIERELRQKEFDTLIREVDSKGLKVIKEWECRSVKNPHLDTYFSQINRVTRLKETIVLTGFNRLKTADEALHIKQVQNGRNLLFRDPSAAESNWLPAYKVYGEGIFFTLNKHKLADWESEDEVQKYFKKFLKRFDKYGARYKSETDRLTPSYLLLHTLAHVIINELSLTCGYSTASLRERLYLDRNQAGLLIYTSSGDSDGTFGGLVRMGKVKNFFPTVHSALERARWCSSDPVCSEIGTSSGQGVNLLNGAACHSCTHLPETSCELGNLFLDRTLLIDNNRGFFRNTIF